MAIAAGVPVLAAGDRVLVAGIAAVCRTSMVFGAEVRARVDVSAVLRTGVGADLGTGVGISAVLGTVVASVWVLGGSRLLASGASFLELERLLGPPTSGSQVSSFVSGEASPALKVQGNSFVAGLTGAAIDLTGAAIRAPARASSSLGPESSNNQRVTSSQGLQESGHTEEATPAC